MCLQAVSREAISHSFVAANISCFLQLTCFCFNCSLRCSCERFWGACVYPGWQIFMDTRKGKWFDCWSCEYYSGQWLCFGIHWLSKICARELASFWNAECAENFQSHFVLVVVLVLTCVAGAQKGKGKELGRETAREGGRERPARSRAPKFPLPLHLLTPAMQAILVLESNVP